MPKFLSFGRSQEEVSKVDYSSKAKSFNRLHYFGVPIGTVHLSKFHLSKFHRMFHLSAEILNRRGCGLVSFKHLESCKLSRFSLSRFSQLKSGSLANPSSPSSTHIQSILKQTATTARIATTPDVTCNTQQHQPQPCHRNARPAGQVAPRLRARSRRATSLSTKGSPRSTATTSGGLCCHIYIVYL